MGPLLLPVGWPLLPPPAPLLYLLALPLAWPSPALRADDGREEEAEDKECATPRLREEDEWEGGGGGERAEEEEEEEDEEEEEEEEEAALDASMEESLSLSCPPPPPRPPLSAARLRALDADALIDARRGGGEREAAEKHAERPLRRTADGAESERETAADGGAGERKASECGAALLLVAVSCLAVQSDCAVCQRTSVTRRKVEGEEGEMRPCRTRREAERRTAWKDAGDEKRARAVQAGGGGTAAVAGEQGG